MADEENPNERFDLDNDYEGGKFVEGEYFFDKKRDKRKQTKDDIIYGMFNDGDSDDEGHKQRPKSKKQIYTEPVEFVSSGKTVTTEGKDGSPPPQEGAKDGVGSGAGGIGFAPAGGTSFVKSKSQMQEQVDMEEASDDERLLPTAFGQRIKKAAAEKQKQKDEETNRSKRSTAKAAETLRTNLGIGAFEAHTKGIGAKLLAKMGFKGKLGKNEQGMAKAIEVSLRPKSAGLGACQADLAMRKQNIEDKVIEPEIEDEKTAGPAPKLWKKRNQDKRVQREYKTAEELLAEVDTIEAQKLATQSTIIDMRGPHARVVTNMESLNKLDEELEKEEPTPMPELQHNLRLIVDLAEANIKQLDAKVRREKETAVILGREQARLRQEMERRAQQVARVGEVLEAVQSARDRTDSHPQATSLGHLQGVFSSLQKRFPEEYVMYQLSAVALHQAHPLFAAHFAGWNPLIDPRRGVREVGEWQVLLEAEGTAHSLFPELAAEGDNYCRLLHECVMPSVRTTLLNHWQARDPEAALLFLEAWDPLLPPPVKTTLLDQLIMPKLQAAVDGWDPRQDTIAIHTWLHPWLPLLGGRMDPLYPTIRYRLSACLQQWHPSDHSARALLAPWQPVFNSNDWEQLLVRSIVPKLQYAMNELVINPQHQILDPFNWVMAWQGAVPAHHMVTILETAFFPKFQQVLYQWLLASPNYDEVTRWYLGWKGTFPQDLQAHERVRHGFNVALDMMNQVLGGATPAPPPMQAIPPPMPSAPTTTHAAAPPPIPGHDWGSNGHLEPSFKDLVERFAGQNDIPFLPKPGRAAYEGLQVYGFGAVSVVLDQSKQLLLAQLADRWAPVSLEQLLMEHRTRSQARC